MLSRNLNLEVQIPDFGEMLALKDRVWGTNSMQGMLRPDSSGEVL